MATIIPNSNAFAVGANTAVSQMQMLEDWRKHAMTTLWNMYNTYMAMRNDDPAKAQLARDMYELKKGIFYIGPDTGLNSLVENPMLGISKGNQMAKGNTIVKEYIHMNPSALNLSDDQQKQIAKSLGYDFGVDPNKAMEIFQGYKEKKSNKPEQNKEKMPGNTITDLLEI